MPSNTPPAATPDDTEAPHKIYTLPCYDIEVRVSPSGAGELTSSLHEGDPVDVDDGDKEYEAAMHAVESLILAHACAGVDILSPAYVKGVEVSVEALTNALL